VDTSGVLAGVTLTRIVASRENVCALSTAGKAYCWGANAVGQIGDGSVTNRSSPVAVDTSGVLAGVDLTEIALGTSNVCAVSSAGAAYCWGHNPFGGVGDGTSTDRLTPVAVDASGVLAGVTLTRVEAGNYFACGLSSAGRIYCWGGNGWGTIGDGTNTDQPAPVPVLFVPADPPTAVSATAGDHSATVSWTAPASTGTARLTGYTATASPGGATCTTTSATTCTITGLDGGTAYTVTVVAHTLVGTSDPSVASDAVTPPVPPGPPTGVTATAGDASAEVSWSAPADLGTGALTGYTATAAPGGATCTSERITECTISGLTNGTAYTVTVVTHTTAGDSTPSEPATATPFAAPAPPTAPEPPAPPTEVTAIAGDASAEVSWNAPADVGASAITGYTATANPGGATCTTAGATRCTIVGLSNGTTYTVTVVAHSTVGDSAPSDPSGPVTPRVLANLPVTGASLAHALTAGVALLAAGAAALAVRRRRGQPAVSRVRPGIRRAE
jgi:LPXTG-motif cell wall-anchored protein